MAEEGEKKRLTLKEVILSPVTLDDLTSLAEGFYLAFASWLQDKEPECLRPEHSVRIRRQAMRFKPWLSMPNTKWTKATLKSDPSRVIGHAGWTTPHVREVYNLWRRDAWEKFGWAEQYGLSDEEVEELWSGTDLVKWQDNFVKYDRLRKEVMGEERHWFLAPLWVIPEYQGRGVAGMLLKEVITLADKELPPMAMYLEASEEGKPVYQRHGFEPVELGPDREVCMVRRGPRKSPV